VSPRGARTVIDSILGDTQGVNIVLPTGQFDIGSIA
jgi:hypothetical protein